MFLFLLLHLFIVKIVNVHLYLYTNLYYFKLHFSFMDVARKIVGKRVLRLILNDLNDHSMYLTSIERHVKDLSIQEQCIVKE